MNWNNFSKEFCKKLWRRNNTWIRCLRLMSCLAHQPRGPAYYIEEYGILNISLTYCLFQFIDKNMSSCSQKWWLRRFIILLMAFVSLARRNVDIKTYFNKMCWSPRRLPSCWPSPFGTLSSSQWDEIISQLKDFFTPTFPRCLYKTFKMKLLKY